MGNNQQLIYQNVVSPLSSIPFHRDTVRIERSLPEGFPVYLAVHRVVSAKSSREKYTDVHTHDDVDEINIILGDEGGLEYEVQLGDEVYQVKSNASIYVPAGLAHAANALSGSGYFIALRIPQHGKKR